MSLQTFEFYGLNNANSRNEDEHIVVSGPHRIFIDGAAGLFCEPSSGEPEAPDSRDMDAPAAATIISVDTGLPHVWVGASIRVTQCFDINGLPSLVGFQITHADVHQSSAAHDLVEMAFNPLGTRAHGPETTLMGWLRKDVAPGVGDVITFATELSDTEISAMILDLPQPAAPSSRLDFDHTDEQAAVA